MRAKAPKLIKNLVDWDSLGLELVDKAMEWLCIVMLAIMTVLVSYQVVTRYFFNNPSAMSENAAQYLFVWLVMFGSAYVFGSREA